ncbi:TetR/AcrR family transcriptional regulator [Hyphomonas sp. NPDC076900]|uniref:TetR/AcrR family transcriptional regulator n=1 Tax=unclassified Hyphomonas TaxID=2630699 RepID=UPI003D01CD12
MNPPDRPASPKAAPRSRAQKPSRNRERLVAAARQLFGAKGYAATGTEEIVAAAGITRGALYYQFADKTDLFRAVLEQALREIGEETFHTTMTSVAHDREDLEVGTQVMLDIFSRPDIERIVLLDGPAVLGWSTWREIQRPLHLALIGHALQHLVDEGLIPLQPLEPLADVISGAAMQAALAIATAQNPKQARKIYGASLSQLLQRLVSKP